jgi:hypothetical protein
MHVQVGGHALILSIMSSNKIVGRAPYGLRGAIIATSCEMIWGHGYSSPGIFKIDFYIIINKHMHMNNTIWCGKTYPLSFCV